MFEPYEASREMGGFIMIDRMTNATVGAGIIDGAEHLARDVHWHKMEVDKRARAALKNQRRPCCGSRVCPAPASRPSPIWWKSACTRWATTPSSLDGDNVRHGLNRDLGFDEADRSKTSAASPKWRNCSSRRV